MIAYRLIDPAGKEYAQEKDLRNRVLRLPLGLELSAADTAGEDRQVHLAAMDERGRVIGCVLMAPAGGSARIRQMAVAEACRRRGIGTELMRRMEATARGMGIRRLTMHARLSALGFYERLGYRTVSEVFTEVTIPHREMEKALDE
jgi:N-acetylglutamate synthase-like GNAT family acetyltransferase